MALMGGNSVGRGCRDENEECGGDSAVENELSPKKRNAFCFVDVSGTVPEAIAALRNDLTPVCCLNDLTPVCCLNDLTPVCCLNDLTPVCCLNDLTPVCCLLVFVAEST